MSMAKYLNLFMFQLAYTQNEDAESTNFIVVKVSLY